MIVVSQKQMDQIHYLIQLSTQGNHVLFGNDRVREAFSTDRRTQGFSESRAYAVEHHIENLILKPTLMEKQAYLERMTPEILEQVIRAYFHIVETKIYDNLEVTH